MIQLSFILSDDDDRAIVQRCIEVVDNYLKEKKEVPVTDTSSADEEQAPSPKENTTEPTDISNSPVVPSQEKGVLYFNVEGDTLSQTNQDNAHYLARPLGDNRYSYEFNIDNGEKKAACNNRDTLLFPFCESTDGSDRDANAFRPVEAGEGTFDTDTGRLTIVKKAKIRMIKE